MQTFLDSNIFLYADGAEHPPSFAELIDLEAVRRCTRAERIADVGTRRCT
jgi:hypothetical protein